MREMRDGTNKQIKPHLVILREGLLDTSPQLVMFPPGHTPVYGSSDMPLRRSNTGGHREVDISVNELQNPPGQQLDFTLTLGCVRLLVRV